MASKEITVFFLTFVFSLVIMANKDVMNECCSLGQELAKNVSMTCGNFPVPILDITVEFQTLCITTMEVCCIANRRENSCLRGLEAAQNGLTCKENTSTCDPTFTECCIACKMASLVDPDQCSNTVNVLPSQFSQNSFVKCCFGEVIQKTSDQDQRCPMGFIFNSNLNVCDDMDECYDGSHTCDFNFDRCVNTVGSYTCDPVNVNDNDKCNPGYKFYLISCIDVDECSENLHNCTSIQVCINTDGSHICETLGGGNNSLQLDCPRGYRKNKATSQCEDINECAIGTHDCNESSQRCDNNLGSYTCIRYITCGTGYTFNSGTGRCEDDDECALGLHNCKALGPAYDCRNTQGSFRCDRRECDLGEVLNEANGHCEAVVCQSGFVPGPQGDCEDIDECRSNPCRSNTEKCMNRLGSYVCLTVCANGLQLTSDGLACEDIDECSHTSDLCNGGRICINIIGSFRCDCPSGYKVAQVSGYCEDIDECSNPYTVCGLDSECQNSPGSYRCICKSGFIRSSSGSGSGSVNDRCVDINECTSISGICQQKCTNLWGSFRCHCRPGYRLAPDGRSCLDIDECHEYNDLCIGNCQNEQGSYRCTCPQGYTLSANERSCQDINECEAVEAGGGSPCRGERQHCFNTRSGFKCVDIDCPQDYEADGLASSKRCKLETTARSCAKTDLPCLRRPVSLSYNFITLVSELRVSVTSSANDLGIDLFTMQSAKYYTLTTRFSLEVKSVRAAKDVTEEADRNFFRLKTPEPHRAVVALVKPIHGPQDVILELRMDMYHLGRYQASAVANLYIYVTPYKF
jgi:fibulin 1/2